MLWHLLPREAWLCFPRPSQDLHLVGTGVGLMAFAEDAEDGELTGSNVKWTSSLDGVLGDGPEVVERDLTS